MNRQPYETDLTDKEWELLKDLIPPAKTGGRPRKTDIREIVNAIFYVLRAGCAWGCYRMIFPSGRQSITTYKRGRKMEHGKKSMPN